MYFLLFVLKTRNKTILFTTIWDLVLFGWLVFVFVTRGPELNFNDSFLKGRTRKQRLAGCDCELQFALHGESRVKPTD